MEPNVLFGRDEILDTWERASLASSEDSLWMGAAAAAAAQSLLLLLLLPPLFGASAEAVATWQFFYGILELLEAR